MPVCHVRLFAAPEPTLILFVCRVINTKQQADNTGSDRHKMWNGQASKNKTKGGQGLTIKILELLMPGDKHIKCFLPHMSHVVFAQIVASLL